MEKLREQYEKEVIPALMKKFEYKSVMQVPKLDKVVINIGLGDLKENPKALENAMNDLTIITGQRPVVTKAKKSIAAFKLREGANIGCKVTLRSDKMYDFVYKLFNVALPRVRDFRGVSKDSFDGRGNYSMGIKEQLIFPEIEYDKVGTGSNSPVINYEEILRDYEQGLENRKKSETPCKEKLKMLDPINECYIGIDKIRNVT